MSTIATQKIAPCLLFDGNAEAAVAHYLGIFKDARILTTSHYGDGRVLLIEFELQGQRFQALNGPKAEFSMALSLSVDCDGQAEVDHFWERLSEGGSEGPCGWLKDKFGLSWQIVPRGMGRLLSDPDPARAARAMQAMMGMRKLDIGAIERAAAAA